MCFFLSFIPATIWVVLGYFFPVTSLVLGCSSLVVPPI
jgi:hypothetical protein